MAASSHWVRPVELALPTTQSAQPPPAPLPMILPVTEQKHKTAEEEEAPSQTPESHNPSQPLTTRKWGLWQSLAGLLLLLFISLMLRDSWLFLTQQWQTHPWVGLFFSVLILALGGTLLAVVGREFSRFRQLRTLSTLRSESSQRIDDQTFGGGHRLANQMALLYQDRTEIAPGLWQFHQRANDYLGDREILHLFSSHVLSVVDDRAYQVVLRHASAAAVMTAISPMAWLDALFFMWRNLWMVREIAEVYGARPGATGSLLLLRQAAQGIMGAGLTDLMASSAAHSMGDSLTALLVARTGQGIANGLFIARIGLQTMQACRPLPFRSTEQPGLGRIRQALQRELTKGFNPGK